MAEIFDPYHKWLGIPPNEQPADHYRLLGLSLFEQDPDVIESAADKVMTHVRSFQNGKHVKQSQKLLNTLAAARVCLLDDGKRAEYDSTIRGSLKRQEPGVRAKPLPPPGTASSTPAIMVPESRTPLAPKPAAVKPLAPRPRSKPKPRPKPAAVRPVARRTVEVGVELGEVLPESSERPVRVRSSRRSQSRPNTSLGVWIAVAAGLFLVAAMLSAFALRDGPPATARKVSEPEGGETDQARVVYRKSFITQAGKAEIEFRKGYAHHVEHDWAVAIACYTEAIRLGPDHVGAYNNRGGVYLAQGEYAKSIPDFTEAIQLDPSSGMAYHNRGFAYRGIGETAKSEADFAKARALGYKP